MARRFIVLFVAVALVAPAMLAWGSADDRAEPVRHGHRAQKFQQWLGLSDDQMAQIRALRQRDADSWKQLASSLREARTELRQLALSGGSPDAVQAKQTEVQQLLGQMVELRVKRLQEMGPLLTEEQRQKFAEGRQGFRHHGRPPRSS
jgi:Spy/CpxP family protein refolding chaperone